MQKNEDGYRRISLVDGLGSYEDNEYLVLRMVECSNENAMFIEEMINHHILPGCLLCSQSIHLKIHLQSYHSSDYFSDYSLPEHEESHAQINSCSPLRSYFTVLLHALLTPCDCRGHYNFILISDCILSLLIFISTKL